MSDTLTQLISKIQAQLLDNGTLFTAATCTAAARQALAELNQAAPQHAATLITAIGGQKEYELSDEDPEATGIVDVLLDGDHERATAVEFDAYTEDCRWFFRLRSPRADGEALIVHYLKPHTVCGLDGASDSTLPDDLNATLICGACRYCCMIRAMATIEANNVEDRVAATWLTASKMWEDSFQANLLCARLHRTAKGDPTHTAWEDAYHDPSYP